MFVQCILHLCHVKLLPMMMMMEGLLLAVVLSDSVLSFMYIEM